MENLIRYSLMAIGFIVTVFILQYAVNFKLSSLNIHYAEGGYIPHAETAFEKERQLKCLAINVYKEAGYEPFEGKVGVAQVTLNRVASDDFPNDICKVVYQKTKVMERIVCQFSWYCDKVHKTRPVNEDAYNESYEVAKKVFLENFKLESLNEALYYHADYVNPKWRKTKIKKIGRHIFYKA